MSYKTEEILSSMLTSLAILEPRDKNKFFKKTRREFSKLKKILGKSLNLDGYYDFDNLSIPINELIKTLNEKGAWTKQELDRLDEDFCRYSLRYLIKQVASMI